MKFYVCLCPSKVNFRRREKLNFCVEIEKYRSGWMGGWMDGWVDVKPILRIAYSNQKHIDKRMSLQKKGLTSPVRDWS